MRVEDMPLEAVRLALKTGLILPDTDVGDLLENYVLAHGVRGWRVWAGEDWRWHPFGRRGETEVDADEAAQVERVLVSLNEARRAVVAGLAKWMEAARDPDERDGEEWRAEILDLLRALNVPARLAEWTRVADERGDLDQGEEHRQSWRDLLELLDDLGFALKGTVLTAPELAAVLEAGFAEFTLGLAPPMLDQVLVGAIERSRQPDLKAAVLLGFNDGMYPRAAGEDTILNDDDRTLFEQSGQRVGQLARTRTVEEPLLVYVALTRPARRLVLTWATADEQGRELRVSPYLKSLCEALPGLSVRIGGDPARDRATWDIHTMSDAAGRLATEFRERPPANRDDPAVRGKFNALYESLRTQAAAEHSWQRAVRAFAESSAERLAPGTRRQLHRPPTRTSVSELETYATCPFKHFARYVLRLDERAAAELEPVDAGKIHHALLEEFVGDLARGNRGIGGLKEEELAAGLERSYDRVLPRLERQAVLSPAREGYLLRRASGDLRKVLRAQGIVAAAGGARPRATELPFGFRRPGSLPALELTTPQGRRVHVRGYIDRVDLAEYADELLGIVVDYKRTRDKRLRLDEAYHGLSLQLLTYLVVLAEHGRTLAGRAVEPLGAFYVSLVPSYTVVEHPSDEREVEKAARAPFRPRGLLNVDRAAALEEATGAWARHYSFYLKKDGGAGLIDSTDAAGGEAFRGMLEHTRRTLGRLVDDLCDGNVDVRPYRLGTASPCGWCPYAAACRFEIDLNEPRYLLPMKRSEVFSRLRETAGRSDPASDASGPPDVRS
jgi:ATP-dependent helicase/nuclease subunit B